MPISSSSTILVTGGTGFIGAWVIAVLLQRGNTVKAIVRSEAKGVALKHSLFQDKRNQGKEALLDVVVDGAFDAAIIGVDGILHLASPLSIDATSEPEEIIGSAVNLTLAVLKSALLRSQSGDHTLKRVVITSSGAAIYTPNPSVPTTFSEKDWNDASIAVVQEQGRDASLIDKYRASKVKAERAAWDFYNNHRGEIQWDMTVLNPPFVTGPAFQAPASPADLPSTLKMWYNLVVVPGEKARPAVLANAGWVDVRDLAEAHVRALEIQEAGSERIIVSEGVYIFQEWLDIANKVKPEGSDEQGLPLGIFGIPLPLPPQTPTPGRGMRGIPSTLTPRCDEGISNIVKLIG
ncbi:D-lactaldehyde dehydrogenase [Ephemerocybe angulata]|uniref:D-lactaldehyde dehydrogenase n=1 Tax=Ephemerocybe angulata TaxID=980116 RepID=A0A8H6LV32_9AGAR|nr:D-lactaldehyde dehydrogenase [Tulosesus angulatus]